MEEAGVEKKESLEMGLKEKMEEIFWEYVEGRMPKEEAIKQIKALLREFDTWEIEVPSAQLYDETFISLKSEGFSYYPAVGRDYIDDGAEEVRKAYGFSYKDYDKIYDLIDDLDPSTTDVATIIAIARGARLVCVLTEGGDPEWDRYVLAFTDEEVRRLKSEMYELMDYLDRIDKLRDVEDEEAEDCYFEPDMKKCKKYMGFRGKIVFLLRLALVKCKRCLLRK